jgi:hypothetical protein
MSERAWPMVRDARHRRALHHEEEQVVMFFATLTPSDALILRSPPKAGVSKDGQQGEAVAP